MATSYYVATGALEDTGLDQETRFATKAEAEEALSVLTQMIATKDRFGRVPTVEESSKPANATFAEWNER